MSDNLLEVKDIHTFIGQFHILEGVSVEVPRGGITVLLGRNGAGKTTTLRSIIGLNQVSQGSITYQSKSLLGQTVHHIAQATVYLRLRNIVPPQYRF